MAPDVWLERARCWRMMRCLGMLCIYRCVIVSIDKSVVTLTSLCLAISTAGGVHAERSQYSTAHSKSIRQNRIQVGSLNINCPINYIIMILAKLFNDVQRKPLGASMVAVENAQNLSSCKESITKSFRLRDQGHQPSNT